MQARWLVVDDEDEGVEEEFNHARVVPPNWVACDFIVCLAVGCRAGDSSRDNETDFDAGDDLVASLRSVR